MESGPLMRYKTHHFVCRHQQTTLRKDFIYIFGCNVLFRCVLHIASTPSCWIVLAFWVKVIHTNMWHIWHICKVRIIYILNNVNIEVRCICFNILCHKKFIFLNDSIHKYDWEVLVPYRWDMEVQSTKTTLFKMLNCILYVFHVCYWSKLS